MDDQDWINLQKLAGRDPQPSPFDPETPDHLSTVKTEHKMRTCGTSGGRR